MDVFIGNLPPSASLDEIRSLHGQWDFNVEVKRVEGRDRTGREYCYFLAHFAVSEEKQARRLIERLNGLSYYGQRIEARPFVHRSYYNERRALNWRDRPWHAEERRRGERRGQRPAAMPGAGP
ncbi:MAG TPA: RNA-binding protein [Sedimenticola sp.]|nr:RNA-binding protein [Sedimenticola sp.]